MKLRIGVFVLMVLLNSLNVLGQKKTLNINVFYTPSYCGGARPNDEMLAEITKPKPYANKKMILISEKGKVYKVKTNEAGSINIKLGQGSYRLLEFWRHYKKSPNGTDLVNFDQLCLVNEWEKETMHITITKDNLVILPKNEIILYCEWAYPCMKESQIPPMPH